MARLKSAVGPGVSLGPKKVAPHATTTLPFTSSLYEENDAPAGTYNPQIQQEVERGREGLNDLLEKLEREAKRGNQDAEQKARELRRTYGQGVQDTNRTAGRNAEDNARTLGYDETDLAHRQHDLGQKLEQLGINFSRSVEDLSTAKQRGQQDYDRTLTNMQHEYGSKAEQQSQNAIQQGTDEAGTNQASAAVRGANQAFDKGNVDLSHNRSEEDFGIQSGRLNQDYERNVAGVHEEQERANEGFGRQKAGIDISNSRNAADQHTAINRLYGALRGGLNANELQRLRNKQDAATEGSHAVRTQTNYETHAAADSVYEANKLHPNLKFPGSTQPGQPSGGPHAYALAPAVAVTHPPSLNGGTTAQRGFGGGRLKLPRY